MKFNYGYEFTARTMAAVAETAPEMLLKTGKKTFLLKNR